MNNAHVTTQPQDGGKSSFWKEVLGWVLSLGAAIIAALLITAFVFQIIVVDGPSMLETLQDGERMFVTKINYRLADPQRFDVVVCHFPERGNTNFVKRIVGIPGDGVTVRDGTLYVNGEAISEEYVDYPPAYRMRTITLGEDQYFVLGDNRAISNDSHIVGPLTRDQIVGEVQAIVWPLSAIRAIH